MGCAASKFELKEEALPPGLKPIHRRIEDAMKRIRTRRYSIVSTTELLSQENAPSDSSSGKAKPSTIVPEPIDEENEVSISVKDEIREDDSKELYRELPGSPSFRFYCVNLPENNQSFDSNDSEKLPQIMRAEDVKETMEKSSETRATEELQDSTEGPEGKQLVKKERGRKLLSLPKTPNAVQNLFTCYSFTSPAAASKVVTPPKQ
ncbi:hypothetical protein FCM35_KLT17731 [Carex littledalei]|uniref:Uncharacterized protein n=1 Tax=Carex littledalei TaxID=544730 RepID=A0A833RMG3_9POAL|nr:hypothetical protein FCM35_KLT17731 [Carex littledalei]